MHGAFESVSRLFFDGHTLLLGEIEAPVVDCFNVLLLGKLKSEGPFVDSIFILFYSLASSTLGQ